jgi:hypothetical protein
LVGKKIRLLSRILVKDGGTVEPGTVPGMIDQV